MENNLRKVFADVCRGYSAAQWRGPIYLKHLSHFEQVDLDLFHDKYYEIALKKKLPNKKEKLEWLEKKGLWLRKNDGALATQKSYVENLEKTGKLFFLKSQIDEHKKTLNAEKQKYLEMAAEKEALLGLTAEKYAEQKMLNHYIFVSFYKDAELKNKLFSQKEFDNLDEDEMDELFSIYIKVSREGDEKNLKKIAVSTFFTSYFYTATDAKDFFGKPICQLSYYQLNLLYYANYYKQIIQNMNIPDNIREDPEKIEEFANATVKAREVAKKIGRDGPTGIVGASNADMAYLGMENSFDPMMAKAAKRGGISSVEEAARL